MKEFSKYKSKLKLLLLATWSPLKRVKEFENAWLSNITIPKRTPMAVNIPTSHKKTGGRDWT